LSSFLSQSLCSEKAHPLGEPPKSEEEWAEFKRKALDDLPRMKEEKKKALEKALREKEAAGAGDGDSALNENIARRKAAARTKRETKRDDL